MNRDYVIVSPCRNEADFIETTLRTVRDQTVPPVQWVIVDDGSTDDGMKIVERYRAEMPYIRIVRRDSAARAVGGGVVRAFDQGYAAVDAPHSFLCKLDVDLGLPPRYFETLLDMMEADPNLGTCSGKPYYKDAQGRMVSELLGDEASIGASKFYRRECFEAIGGFVPDVGWDGFDCHSARWHGWRALSRDGADLRMHHLRPMGSSQSGIHAGRVRHGRGQWLLGAHPLFFLASSLVRSVRQKPYITGTLASMKGYFGAWLAGEKRFGTPEMVRFIQAYQMRALFRGKVEAAEWAYRRRRAELDAAAPAG